MYNLDMEKIKLEEIKLTSLQPSQFLISIEKVKKIEKWFNRDNLSNFSAIPVKILDGDLVMTDGHTRAVVAIMHGLDYVPLVWEKEELSWDMYQECVKECKRQNIKSPYDLLSRIVDEDEYKDKWDKWCDKMQEEVINRRNNKVSN